MWRGIVVGAALVASGTMVACTLLVPTDEVQCATADDCHARGPAFASAVCVANVCQVAADAGAHDAGAHDPWGCLDQPSLASDPSPSVNMPVVLYEELGQYSFGSSSDGGSDLTLAQYTPQSGVTVTACTALDVDCTSPLSGPTVTGDSGVAIMTVPGSFDGFFGLNEPGGLASMFYTGRILPGDSTNGYPIAETSQANFALLTSSLGIAANSDTDAGPGIVSVTQFDCFDHHAAGIAVATSPAAARTIYLYNGLPDSTATSTSSDGSSVLVNVPSGSALVTTTLPGQNNRVIGTANVAVKPGGITLLYMRARSH
jgi:hypothetical protein